VSTKEAIIAIFGVASEKWNIDENNQCQMEHFKNLISQIIAMILYSINQITLNIINAEY